MFVSPTDGRIGIVPADSGAERDLYVPPAGGPLAELAIFSANGRELYFKSHDTQYFTVEDRQSDIWVAELARP